MHADRKLIILVGLPGCGKSTWANLWYPEAQVSTDAIRKSLSGNQHDQTLNDEVFDIFHLTLGMFLRNREDGIAVADSTALDFDARRQLRNVAEKNDAEKHLVIFTNLSQAVTRNAARIQPVPGSVMVRMIAKYEKALADIPLEDYHSVTYIGETQ
jgi:predicted kinase